MEKPVQLALWLMPDGILRDHLSGIIRSLSSRYHTPLFQPHMTICSGSNLNQDEISAAVRELAARLAPIEIELSTLDMLDDYYRCLFIRVAPSATLTAVQKHAASIMHRKTETYLPHISLMYGNIAIDEKRRLMARLDTGFARHFRAKSLYLYSVAGKPEDWYYINDYPLLGKETFTR